MDPLALARPEILALEAYRHAAWDPRLERLHANELPWRNESDRSAAGLNRYPEPYPEALSAQLAALYGIDAPSALVCRGSDEAIDLLVRAFCAAGRDAVLVCPPTFGMYAVSARIQGAGVVSVPLLRERGYTLDVASIAAHCAQGGVKLVFLCSPNNPTGNRLLETDVASVVDGARGHSLVVIDEAYLEFAGADSHAALLAHAPHVVVLRTLSKAYGLAGARIGTLIADPRVIALLRKVMPPYATAQPCIEASFRALTGPQQRETQARIRTIVDERERLVARLALLPGVTQVWPSAANFLLVEFADAGRALEQLAATGLLARDFRGRDGLGEALRITVGSPVQNERLLRSLA